LHLACGFIFPVNKHQHFTFVQSARRGNFQPGVVQKKIA